MNVFRVTYRVWGKEDTEDIAAETADAARAEVNRTLFGPDAKILSADRILPQMAPSESEED